MCCTKNNVRFNNYYSFYSFSYTHVLFLNPCCMHCVSGTIIALCFPYMICQRSYLVHFLHFHRHYHFRFACFALTALPSSSFMDAGARFGLISVMFYHYPILSSPLSLIHRNRYNEMVNPQNMLSNASTILRLLSNFITKQIGFFFCLLFLPLAFVYLQLLILRLSDISAHRKSLPSSVSLVFKHFMH